MVIIAGWGIFISLVITNIVIYLLIDGYFEGDIAGLRDDDWIHMCTTGIDLVSGNQYSSKL